MTMSLSIELESDYFCMESTYAQTCIKGHLLISYNSKNADKESHGMKPHDILHDSSSTGIQILGKEWIGDNKDDATILIDDTYHLPTRDWHHHPEHQCFSLPFDIPLPRDIPISFEGDECGIDYRIKAYVRCLKNTRPVVNAARPLILLRGPPFLTISPSSSSSSLLSPSPSLISSSSFLSSTSASPSSSSSSSVSNQVSPFAKAYPSPSSSSLSLSTFIEDITTNRMRLCWGMSARSQWQYELELPQLIDVSQAFSITLRTRTKRPSSSSSSSSKHSSSMESCMIGIQIYESVRVGFKPRSNQVLMTTSHVLTHPSKTWSNPCIMNLALDHLPKTSTLSGSRIKVSHHFEITINYCSSQGQNDRVHINCIIPLITLPSSHTSSHLSHCTMSSNENAKGMTAIYPLSFHPTSEFPKSI